MKTLVAMGTEDAGDPELPHRTWPGGGTMKIGQRRAPVPLPDSMARRRTGPGRHLISSPKYGDGTRSLAVSPFRARP